MDLRIIVDFIVTSQLSETYIESCHLIGYEEIYDIS